MGWGKVGAFLKNNGLKILGTAASVAGGGPVVSMIAEAIGADENEDQVLAALEANPEALLKMQELEATNKVTLQKLILEDRVSARAHDVAIVEKKGRNLRADILAFAAIGGLIALIIVLVVVPLEPGPAHNTLLLLAGGLIAIVKDVYGFEFGSSRGSKEKDVLLQKVNGKG